MKRSLDLDDDLAAAVDRAASLVREKPATVMRLAIRAGLPAVTSRSQPQRPPGYFAADYPLPAEVRRLEAAMAKVKIAPDR